MGTSWSSLDREPSPDPFWPPLQNQDPDSKQDVGEEKAAETSSKEERGRVRLEELEAFKQELAQKRALRHEAMSALQSEMRALRQRVEEEKKLRLQAELERDTLRVSSGFELQGELDSEREEKKKLVEERDQLKEEVEEKAALERQVQALKDVSQIGKEMLRIRELQVKELKKKLVEINLSSVMAPPEDLRVEYEKQIENIRKLRTLYEERAAATLLKHRQELEREEARITVLETKLSDLQKETELSKEAKKELEGKIEKLEKTIEQNDEELRKTKDNLFSITVQNKSLNSQLTLINNLFSQMLVSPKVDLDRLTRLLKENRGLITDLTENGDSNEVAALLVDLADQVEKEQEADQNSIKEQSSSIADDPLESQSEIASNLTKVWRVMVELLSHHQNTSHTELSGGVESCYKCIQTPTGPRSVISVSQTFLTLKDLILEKNQLVQEVGRLKTLNNHLEHRLGSQEKRLSVVTTELRKTWGVVNKLKAQHKQLHTHEKILRYELQQKRCMLTELKEELEHCRDKWERARQKNTQTEEDWKKLRKEFAARKSRKESNSAESGYEEEDVVHSPPSEPVNHEGVLFEIRPCDESEPDLSEEDIEHSDGNSFDTVIDLLDITCFENQTENESEIPFVLSEVPLQTSEISPSLLPLTGSEFTEGLDQIESEDLAAVLDVQYQNQLLGADYNLSLPSSSGSSPIPTENDDFASSEMDVSEEDSSFNDNHIHSSPLPIATPSVPEDMLLFGSNSSKNISKFLDGLFVDQGQNRSRTSPQSLFLDVPSTSHKEEDIDNVTPLVNDENHDHFSNDSATPLINNENCYEFPSHIEEVLPERKMCIDSSSENESMDAIEPYHQALPLSTQNHKDTIQASFEQAMESPMSSETVRKTTEEALKSREDRLKRLERECRSLVSKVTSTTFKSETISNKHTERHLPKESQDDVSDFEEELLLNREDNNSHGQHQIQSLNLNAIHDNVGATSLNYTMQCENAGPRESASSSSQGPSQSCSQSQKRTPEEILEARAARLKRLEDQCKSLFSKMSATSSRSKLISNKLDELHDSYGPCDQETKFDTQTSKLCSSIKKPLTSEKVEMIEFKPCEIKFASVSKVDNKDSKPPDLASESKEILNKCSLPGPSVEPIAISNFDSKKERTPEEILDARAERFKRLEEQCKSLVSKMTATSLRSEIISNKLDELHSCYGSSEDVSDSDEHSLSSKEDDKRKSTPTLSPRHARKLARSAEKEKRNTEEAQERETDNKENITERVTFPSTSSSRSENTDGSSIESSDQPKRSPEEILQARAQRLNRLEEQCKSLFCQMSATSQRSNVISNRLEELHEQYGQPLTSEVTTTSQSSRHETNNGEEQRQVQSMEKNELPTNCTEQTTSASTSTESECHTDGCDNKND